VTTFRSIDIGVLVLCASVAWGGEEILVVPGLAGHPGGRLVYGERAEPMTLNPVFASDLTSRDIVNRITADLVHINRATLKTECALAKSYKVSPDGLVYEIELRQGLKFSDGHPFDADDVVFTFEVYLDEALHSPQRRFWVLDGQPIQVRKLNNYRVAFHLPRVNAVGERIFDSVPMLPRHLLERPYREGKLKAVWNLRTPPAEIAGLGPFRLKEVVPGQRVVLERNPYYWKSDSSGHRLPYLAEMAFTFSAGEDMQVMRFQAGESDMISRLASRDYAVLERESARRGYTMQDAGAGLEFSFMAFNLDDAARGRVWNRLSFRKAVSAAIDRAAIVRLVYQGYAEPLATPVAAGNRQWVDALIPPTVRSLERAREILTADGFKWSRDGVLLDPQGAAAHFSIATSSGNPERVQIATLIQADLKQLGIQVDVVSLELASLVERVITKREFDATILTVSSADADPNSDMNFWVSTGTQHAWRQRNPAMPWEAEIDGIMRKQLVTRKYAERKRLFDRVQEISVENMPAVPLVSPHTLVGAKKGLANFKPVLLEPYALWNVEELYWQSSGGGLRR
jgi:peptide/nickel transport system substrate-binding protein